MSFKLEDLPYQRQAIDSVVRLFEGQQRNYFDLQLQGGCFPNRLFLTRQEIVANVEKVSAENGISHGEATVCFDPDYCVEMETGTGKTLVYIEEKEAASFLTLSEDGEQAVFDEVLLKNGFQLHYKRSRRDDFSHNTVYEVSDPRRTALVCLAWSENIHDTTIKRLRELADAGERPFFICLERSLSTTSKWNLKHFLGNHFNAF